MALKKRTVESIGDLSASERILLAQDLWDSIADDPDAWTLSAAQRQELDRRLKAIQRRKAAGESSGSSWPDVKRRILRKR